MGRDARSAAEGFLRAMTPRLRGYLRVLLADPNDAEDALQETFLAYLKSGPGPGAAESQAWLFRVSRNRALNLLRDEGRRRRREEVHAAAAEAAADPADRAAQAEAARRMEVCLQMVPLDAREMLYLKAVEGLSLREIAERTGTPKSTVALRLQEGLVLLNRLFRGGGPR